MKLDSNRTMLADLNYLKMFAFTNFVVTSRYRAFFLTSCTKQARNKENYNFDQSFNLLRIFLTKSHKPEKKKHEIFWNIRDISEHSPITKPVQLFRYSWLKPFSSKLLTRSSRSHPAPRSNINYSQASVRIIKIVARQIERWTWNRRSSHYVSKWRSLKRKKPKARGCRGETQRYLWTARSILTRIHTGDLDRRCKLAI